MSLIYRKFQAALIPWLLLASSIYSKQEEADKLLYEVKLLKTVEATTQAVILWRKAKVCIKLWRTKTFPGKLLYIHWLKHQLIGAKCLKAIRKLGKNKYAMWVASGESQEGKLSTYWKNRVGFVSGGISFWCLFQLCSGKKDFVYILCKYVRFHQRNMWPKSIDSPNKKKNRSRS